jgi:hypothetical protein
MGTPMHRLLIAVDPVGMLVSGSLMAQYQSQTFGRWKEPAAGVSAARWVAAQAGPLEVPTRDYRYEGLLSGGVAMGALAAWIGSRVTQSCPTEPGVECGSDKLGFPEALSGRPQLRRRTADRRSESPSLKSWDSTFSVTC